MKIISSKVKAIAIALLFAFPLLGFSQGGLWNANGSNITYTNRKVGIGTSNPQSPLQVKGQMIADSIRIFGKLHIGTNSLTLGGNPITGNEEINSTTGAISFGNTVAPYSNILIGIGTQTPFEALHIHDGGFATNIQITNNATTPGINTGYQMGIDNIGRVQHIQNTNQPLAFWMNNGTPGNIIQRMIILNNGNVGIGNNFNTPQSLLHVDAANTGTGEVFRTDCFFGNSTFWRMFRGGQEKLC